MAMGQAEADDLLHRRAARGFPGAGARSGGTVPHAYRATADRGPRRSEAARRDRALRPPALYRELAARRTARELVLGEGPRPLAEPRADLRSMRPAALLPPLRARLLRATAEAVSQRRKDDQDS